jgi:hypothetical protein
MVSLFEKQYINCTDHNPGLMLAYVKFAEKGTLFIFGQKTEKVVSNKHHMAFHFFHCIY